MSKVIDICGLILFTNNVNLFESKIHKNDCCMYDLVIALMEENRFEENEEDEVLYKKYDNDILVSSRWLKIYYENEPLISVNKGQVPWVVYVNHRINSAVVEEFITKIVIPHFYYKIIRGIPLHASSVIVNGELICIAGASFSGKTTLVYNILQQKYTMLMSDDVTPISIYNDKIYAHSGSQIIKIREETARNFSIDSSYLHYENNVSKQEIKKIFYINPDTIYNKVSAKKYEQQHKCGILLANLYATYFNSISAKVLKDVSFISKKIDVYELNYKKEFDIIPKVIDTILGIAVGGTE